MPAKKKAAPKTATKLRGSDYGQDQWAWGAHLRRAKRARRVRPRRKRPNQFTATTYKLAKMNLAVRGLSANLGEVPADTFFKDQHPDPAWRGTDTTTRESANPFLRRSQTVGRPRSGGQHMANPPFNLKDWRGPDELVHDGRWNGYDTPPTGNANYAWILHMVSKLSENGVAGFVLASSGEPSRTNGSMSTNTKGEGEIRQKLVENDLVDCMIALPGQLFFTTQIPVCIWILSKNKKGAAQSPSPQTPLPEGEGLRDRSGETLFIDARKIGSMISRTQKELTAEDISEIADTYHAWKHSSPSGRSGDEGQSSYENIPGYCYSAELVDIRKHDFVLTPGRYVGAAAIEDDGIPFETKMTEMSQTLYGQMAEAKALDKTITENLKSLGYGKK